MKMIKTAILFLFNIYIVYANETIACGDGKMGILNDDYCDCPADGRDEPNTSACYHGQLICREPANEGIVKNVVHVVEKLSSQEQKKIKDVMERIPVQISSSKVLDGVCDCCDGSDEINGWVDCKNSCNQVLNQLQKLVKSITNDLEKGLSVKENLIVQAKSKKIKMAKDVVSKKKELVTLKNELESYQDSLQIAKNREDVELKESEEERAKTCPEIESLKSEKNRYEELNSENSKLTAQISELQSGIAEWKQKYLDLFEAFKINSPAESIAKFDLNFQTTTTDGESPVESETTTLSNPEPLATGVKKPLEISSITPSCLAKIFGQCLPRLLLPIAKRVGFVKASEAIQREVEKHNSKISVLEREIDNLEKNQDYGPDDIWLAFDKTCLNVDVLEYNYEICLFGSSSQKKIDDSTSVNLGQFSRYGTRNQADDGDQNYFAMLYENGQGCWNGPSRSVEITFDCGPENKIVSVEEPSRCEYTMKAISPIACTVGSLSNSKKEEYPEL